MDVNHKTYWRYKEIQRRYKEIQRDTKDTNTKRYKEIQTVQRYVIAALVYVNI